jgi:hypothetical protein
VGANAAFALGAECEGRERRQEGSLYKRKANIDRGSEILLVLSHNVSPVSMGGRYALLMKDEDGVDV